MHKHQPANILPLSIALQLQDAAEIADPKKRHVAIDLISESARDEFPNLFRKAGDKINGLIRPIV